MDKIKVERVRTIGFTILGLAAAATLCVIVHISSGMSSFLNVGFDILFVISPIFPYIVMGYFLTIKSDSYRKVIFKGITILVVSIFGLYGMIDIVYIHPDAQGGIALAILPFLQIFAFIVLTGMFSIIADFRLR